MNGLVEAGSDRGESEVEQCGVQPAAKEVVRAKPSTGLDGCLHGAMDRIGVGQAVDGGEIDVLADDGSPGLRTRCISLRAASGSVR